MKRKIVDLLITAVVFSGLFYCQAADAFGQRKLKSAPEQAPAANPVVRFTTNFGNIDVELYPGTAPLTVTNFLGYVGRNDYNGSFIHRLVPSFVLQGGGYKFVNDNVEIIPSRPPVNNEFSISNTRGTLAMAKFPGDPNSAANEWYFNLADNFTLDTQNGGFTVFGRVLGNGSMAVLNTIAALQVYNAGSPFDQLPVVNYTAGATITSSNLVNLISVTQIAFNTQNGGNVTVTSANGNANVTFGQVTSPGDTTFTAVNPPSSAGSPPTGYTILGSGPAYDITTTAVITAPITTCFTVASVNTAAAFANLRILHGESGVLLDRTILAPDSPAPDFATRRVCARTTSLSPFVTAINIATAAGVAVSGRVLASDLRGVTSTRVMLTDSSGNVRSTFTGRSGRFAFSDVEAGETYILRVISRRYQYTPQVLQITDNVTDLEFLPVP